MEEIWRDIKGYEGLYQVSNTGKVKSLKRKMLNRWKNGFKIMKEKVLKPYKNYNNHLYVKLVNNTIKTIFVHRLVAFAFPEICGEWFEGAEVHHIDLNPLNNNAENLIFISKERHKELHNNSSISIERRIEGSKFQMKPIIQLTKDYVLVNSFSSINEAERKTGISHTKISLVCQGKRNTSGGFIWKYKN